MAAVVGTSCEIESVHQGFTNILAVIKTLNFLLYLLERRQVPTMSTELSNPDKREKVPGASETIVGSVRSTSTVIIQNPPDRFEREALL